MIEQIVNYYWENLASKQQQNIYDIITGRLKYPPIKYQDHDVEPHLILKMNFPKQRYISLNQKPNISQFVSLKAENIMKVYNLAEKAILQEMYSANQQNESAQMRMFTSFNKIESQYMIKQVIEINYEIDKLKQIEIICNYKKNKQLDLFTIQLNTIILILQKICGFRVRSFLIQDDQQQEYVLLFITLSQQNLLRLAENFQIKKQVYLSSIDFNLNDPTSSDGRPLKFHSSLQRHKYSTKKFKQIGRYFKKNQLIEAKFNTIINQQDQIDFYQKYYQKFNDYQLQISQIFKKLKQKDSVFLSFSQKLLISRYLRGKNILGCLSIMLRQKKKEYYFQLLKNVLPIYGYKINKQKRIYKQFFLPTRYTRGSCFQKKVQALVLNIPYIINNKGDLDYFNSMQKSKICYRILKDMFKIDFLAKLKYQFLTLDNHFQKQGQIISNNIKFQNLKQSWPFHALFLNIYAIRNYYGNNIAFQISTISYLMQFLFIMSPIYILLYIIENIYGNLITDQLHFFHSGIFVIGFQFYYHRWKKVQEQFKNSFLDGKNSKTYLKSYKGHFRRNIVNDQINEFPNTQKESNIIGNTICTIIILCLFTIVSVFFYIARLILYNIYGKIKQTYLNIFSLEHIISYFIYFILLYVLQKVLTDNIMIILIKILNPSTDQHLRKLVKSIMFHFLLGIQIIGPVFFLIIEPVTRTSCYANSCRDEFQYYISSRYAYFTTINILKLLFHVIFIIVQGEKDQVKHRQQIYLYKMKKILEKAVKEKQKQQFTIQHSPSIIYLVTFGMYCTIFTISSIHSVIGLLAFHLKIRFMLFYKCRRPIDKSQKVLFFIQEMKFIYYFAVIFNSWVTIFSYEVVQKYAAIILPNAALDQITISRMLFIRFVIVAFYSIGLIILGKFVALLISIFQSDCEAKRSYKKVKDYQLDRKDIRIQQKIFKQLKPIKTIFRVYNDNSIVRKLILEYLLGLSLIQSKYPMSSTHMKHQEEQI